MGQLRDKLRDTEIALRRSQRQLSDLQEQHARAGAELRASWAKREAETSMTNVMALCPSCSKSTSGSEKDDSSTVEKEAEEKLEELKLSLATSQERVDSFANELFKAQDQLSSASSQLIQQRRRINGMEKEVREHTLNERGDDDGVFVLLDRGIEEEAVGAVRTVGPEARG